MMMVVSCSAQCHVRQCAFYGVFGEERFTQNGALDTNEMEGKH